SARLCGYGDCIGAARRDRRGEGECAVGGDGQVVTAIVLQDQPGTGESRHRASDREVSGGSCRARDGDGRYIRAGSPTAARDRARLCRTRRLRHDGDGIRRPGVDGGREREGSVPGYGEVVSAVVLQNQSRARQTRDRSTDGVSGRRGWWRSAVRCGSSASPATAGGQCEREQRGRRQPERVRKGKGGACSGCSRKQTPLPRNSYKRGLKIRGGCVEPGGPRMHSYYRRGARGGVTSAQQRLNSRAEQFHG